MAYAIRRVVARHSGKAPKIAAFPLRLIRLLAPFLETLRELLEMRYLWQQPGVRMDNAKLVSALGWEPLTPLDAAVEKTLKRLKCLP
ncbi:hypothetical protein [Microbulbifer magnicolonia]|uniref:hypothetical protein n=1 Tax=Microbulbifer magnicolonia TaxID=3109744 RepID=UPI002B405AAF|nr:hypothetical protein [Microbulbifer sp. GG15]